MRPGKVTDRRIEAFKKVVAAGGKVDIQVKPFEKGDGIHVTLSARTPPKTKEREKLAHDFLVQQKEQMGKDAATLYRLFLTDYLSITEERGDPEQHRELQAVVKRAQKIFDTLFAINCAEKGE